MVQPSPRRAKALFTPVTNKEIEYAREAIAEAAPEPEEDIEYFLTPADRRTPEQLFSNPPKRFIAALSYGDTVNGYLLENNYQEGYLAYLCNCGTIWTVVYVYDGQSRHQRNMIRSVYGSEIDADWRVVPITNRNSGSKRARNEGHDWSVWIFHRYFMFDLFGDE